MKIYTRTGDTGETLLPGGRRVSKASLIIDAVGNLDELNSFIGYVVSHSNYPSVNKTLTLIQNTLFEVGAEIAVDPKNKNQSKKFKLRASKINFLEKKIDDLDSKLPPLKYFILPGGSQVSASFHLARAISRRAERSVVLLAEVSNINPNVIKYLNRLSDLLFVLARYTNILDGNADIIWKIKP
jgi:cob(I)alamin adenosyltransferase